MSSEKCTVHENFRLSSEKCTVHENFRLSSEKWTVHENFRLSSEKSRKIENFRENFFEFFEKNSCKTFFGEYNRPHEKHIGCFSPLPLEPMEVSLWQVLPLNYF